MSQPSTDVDERLSALQQRLDEAESTLAAIRAGAVDAFVVDRGAGERVYTIEAADRRYRLLVESMQQGAAVVLVDGTVLFANSRLSQLLDLDAATMRGHPIHHCVAPSSQAIVHDAVRRGRTEAVQAELTLELASGRHIAVDWSSVPMPVDESAAIGIVITDLSERRRHEAALRTSERLQLIDRRKNEFLATLAHELRNPLAPITNAIALLRDEQVAEATARRALDIVERQVRTLTRLVDDLLDLGRITTGRVALDRAPVRVDVVLHRAVETSQPLMQGGGHTLEIVASSGELWVHGDEGRLAQVFSNLLNNAAVYATAPSRIQLLVTDSRDQVRVEVRDQGIGDRSRDAGRGVRHVHAGESGAARSRRRSRDRPLARSLARAGAWRARVRRERRVGAGLVVHRGVAPTARAPGRRCARAVGAWPGDRSDPRGVGGG